ncbi:MAG: hypothetical protein IKZ19_04000, partial [Clostridia bacterium]|nr:hypothetical protein [Clostridia bacterium]
DMFRIHHPPKGEATVSDFKVILNGEETLPWFCRVSAMPYNTVWPGCQRPIDQTEIASFISFEMDSPVTVELEAAKDFEKIAIRPLSKNIKPSLSGRKIIFTLPAAGHYTVELDGSHNALHIFANPYTDFGVDKNADNVIYYGPGVYDIGNMELEEGQILYVDGGAVLYGSVTAIHKENVGIVGYGVIDGSKEIRDNDTLLLVYSIDEDLRDESILRRRLKETNCLNGCVRLYSCKNSSINGVITRDSSTFAVIIADCENIDCEWVKTIGMWRYNSDGIDTFNSRYIRIAYCFLRDFDDCVVLKGIGGWDKENQHHITVTGCTIWCDWGRGLELGAETCADEYHDILWLDCDLIHGCHIHIDLQNLDRARIHHMLVKNIRCEYAENEPEPMYQHDMNAPYEPQNHSWAPTLIASPIHFGPWAWPKKLGSTDNIRFEDIYIIADHGVPMPQIAFSSEAEGNANRDIVIENVCRNGTRLKEEEITVRKSPFDCNISFR